MSIHPGHTKHNTSMECTTWHMTLNEAWRVLRRVWSTLLTWGNELTEDAIGNLGGLTPREFVRPLARKVIQQHAKKFAVARRHKKERIDKGLMVWGKSSVGAELLLSPWVSWVHWDALPFRFILKTEHRLNPRSDAIAALSLPTAFGAILGFRVWGFPVFLGLYVFCRKVWVWSL